jgi:subtilase family serine protease
MRTVVLLLASGLLLPGLALPDEPGALEPDLIAGLTPAQVRSACGFDRLPFDGSGQTIAIVDAFGHPD